MPIYEYLCDSCGDKFEKLVRRASDVMESGCPSCGDKHLTQQYSTFAARGSQADSDSPRRRPAVAKAACAARPVSAAVISDGVSKDSVPSPLEIESIKRTYSSGGLKCLPLQRAIVHNSKFVGTE